MDGNDNVWVSNFAMASSPIVQLCGVRTEHCPPGFKTGDQISPPGGYVGGGLQLQTDIAVGPAGDVWAINNWQDIDSCYPGATEALSTRCGDLPHLSRLHCAALPFSSISSAILRRFASPR